MRRLTRFSLRALLLVVTAFCLVLGYGANWKYQRQQFAADEVRKAEAAGVKDNHGHFAHWQRVDSFVNPLLHPDAPVALRILGEPGYPSVSVGIPLSDAQMKTFVDRDGNPLWTYYTTTSQADYARAVRLFPEARILPCVVINRLDEFVCVMDARTGKPLPWAQACIDYAAFR